MREGGDGSVGCGMWEVGAWERGDVGFDSWEMGLKGGEYPFWVLG